MIRADISKRAAALARSQRVDVERPGRRVVESQFSISCGLSAHVPDSRKNSIRAAGDRVVVDAIVVIVDPDAVARLLTAHLAESEIE